MIVALSAMHGRHEVSRAWAEHTASLGFDHVIVSVSEGDEENYRTCEQFNFARGRVPNEPLAGKFNAALAYAMLDSRYTRFMILPSDDFASPAWVKAARETEGDYLYPHTCAVVDSATQNAYTIRKLSFGTLKYGAGRVISRKAIDKLGGYLWPENLMKGLDSASHHRIEGAGFKVKVVETEGIPITDLKTEENLWPYSTWQTSSRPCTADQALHMVSPSVRAKIDALKR